MATHTSALRSSPLRIGPALVGTLVAAALLAAGCQPYNCPPSPSFPTADLPPRAAPKKRGHSRLYFGVMPTVSPTSTTRPNLTQAPRASRKPAPRAIKLDITYYLLPITPPRAGAPNAPRNSTRVPPRLHPTLRTPLRRTPQVVSAPAASPHLPQFQFFAGHRRPSHRLQQ